MSLDQRADAMADAIRTMRKWGFGVIEDTESAKRPEGDRMMRAEVIAVEMLGPEAKGSAAAERVAQAILRGAEVVRTLPQFAANMKSEKEHGY